MQKIAEDFVPSCELERIIVEELFEMQDKTYRDFHACLIPTVDKSKIIGVRTPQLRRYARALKKDGRGDDFLGIALPHYYYEQMNLHAFLIEQERDFERAVSLTETFLPHVDNWATCDMFSPKVFLSHADELLPYVRKWLLSGDTYTVRYGVVRLLNTYLDEHFEPFQLDWAVQAACDNAGDFYVEMAVAWYFSMALVKKYEFALPYLKNRRLPTAVHNKTIQKVCESRQFTPEIKDFMKSMRIR
jgi:3-methyladenine DNA glycosylase AlkD